MNAVNSAMYTYLFWGPIVSIFVAPILVSEWMGNKVPFPKFVRCIVGLSLLFMPAMFGGDGFALPMPWWAITIYHNGAMRTSVWMAEIALGYFTVISLAATLLSRNKSTKVDSRG